MASTVKHRRLSLMRVRQRRGEGGFSLLELLIALTILLIGITGILTMQIVSLRATAYSRHATEAAVLAEDKLEQLRTVPINNALLANGDENINAQGLTTGNAQLDFFRRQWSTVWVAGVGTVTVTVRWLERGSEPHAITMRTQRTAP